MATLDDINILDRVKTDPQLLLQAGRQPTVERVKPTFNPASDYFYNNVLNDSGRRMVDFASSIVNDPFHFGGYCSNERQSQQSKARHCIPR
jgi:hypothetical protein